MHQEFLSVRTTWNLGIATGLTPGPSATPGSGLGVPAPPFIQLAMCLDKTDRTLPSWSLPSMGQTDKPVNKS